MREEIKVLELDKYEYPILIKALNYYRNGLIQEKQEDEASYLAELLMKVIDLPSKKKGLTKTLRKDNAWR